MAMGPRLSLAALAVFLLPSSTSAQEEPRPMYELPTITVTVLSEADPLFETASALYQAGDWSGAAQLYRTAAEGMSRNGADSYVSFDMSARLYFYAGEYGTSREMMERAAEIAEATGDMVSAAYRHVDAAFISIWEGFPAKRREHVQAAETLAREDGFPETDVVRVDALIRGVSSLPVDEDD
ncbi:MAG: hypothetical protein ABFS14_04035 [Gemmatimonadota bacterium]